MIALMKEYKCYLDCMHEDKGVYCFRDKTTHKVVHMVSDTDDDFDLFVQYVVSKYKSGSDVNEVRGQDYVDIFGNCVESDEVHMLVNIDGGAYSFVEYGMVV